jgi:hypothetical protein
MLRHRQIRTPFGFTCDEGILPFVVAARVVGMETLGSCEADNNWRQQRWIFYTHSDPKIVFAFALHLKKFLPYVTCWQQKMGVDNNVHTLGHRVTARVDWDPVLDTCMYAAMVSFLP